MHNNDHNPIAVLGAGAWGTALAMALARNGQSVRLWGHRLAHVERMRQCRENERYLPGISLPDNIHLCDSLEQSLADCQDVLVVVPSAHFRALIKKLHHLAPAARIVWGTKGLDPDTGATLDTVVREVFGPQVALAVLTGPSFAKEVALSLPTAVTLASGNRRFSQDLIGRFHNPYFRIYPTEDVIGVELCGVVKNILAIAAGISDGLGLGANAKSALITRGFAELGRLLAAKGGQAATLTSLAGFGDTLLTATDNQSRNRRFGLAIGQGASIESALAEIGDVVEGYQNARYMHALAVENKVDMPILAAVYNILYRDGLPADALAALLARRSSAN